MNKQVHDIGALSRFETFLATAVATVVLVRAFLIVSGYPQVGGNGLHIAHVLWGGLLMGVAIVIGQVGQGSRSRRRAAIFGGIGFGLFIDEVGKFLTKDVNYFFRPAIAIIYAVFVAFFLIVRDVVLRRALTDPKRLAIATNALADLALGQLSDDACEHAVALVDAVTTNRPLAEAIATGLHSVPAEVPGPEGVLTRLHNTVSRVIRRLSAHPQFDRGVSILFIAQLVAVLGELALVLAFPHSPHSTGYRVTAVATTASAALSALFVVLGLLEHLRRRRSEAMHWLVRSVLVTTLFTQLFVFTLYQVAGVAGLLAELLVYAALRLEAGTQITTGPAASRTATAASPATAPA